MFYPSVTGFFKILNNFNNHFSVINGGHRQEFPSISQIDGTTNKESCSLIKESLVRRICLNLYHSPVAVVVAAAATTVVVAVTTAFVTATTGVAV